MGATPHPSPTGVRYPRSPAEDQLRRARRSCPAVPPVPRRHRSLPRHRRMPRPANGLRAVARATMPGWRPRRGHRTGRPRRPMRWLIRARRPAAGAPSVRQAPGRGHALPERARTPVRSGRPALRQPTGGPVPKARPGRSGRAPRARPPRPRHHAAAAPGPEHSYTPNDHNQGAIGPFAHRQSGDQARPGQRRTRVECDRAPSQSRLVFSQRRWASRAAVRARRRWRLGGR